MTDGYTDEFNVVMLIEFCVVKQMEVRFYRKTQDFFEFSNYHQSPMTIDGVTYNSNEQFFQAQKFMYTHASQATKDYFTLICQTDTPQKAKDMGSQRVNFRGGRWFIRKSTPCLGRMNDTIRQYKHVATMNPEWDTVKEDIMLRGLMAKFTQSPELRELLLSTGDRYLVEDSPRDSYWGVGKDGHGHNRLGHLLMVVRECLKTNPRA